jgi:hypothetical protein
LKTQEKKHNERITELEAILEEKKKKKGQLKKKKEEPGTPMLIQSNTNQ